MFHWEQESVKGQFYKAYRILVALYGLIYWVRAFSFRHLLWSPNIELERTGLFLLHALWLLFLILLWVSRNRWIAFFHFVVASLFLRLHQLGNGIEAALFCHLAFWLITTREEESAPAWPAYGLGFSLCLLMAGSGIAKWESPAWRSGAGLVSALSYPGIGDESLVRLLKGGLGRSLNYFIVASEIILPFLFLIRKTWLIAVSFLTFFFLLLIFPVGLGLIGHFGMIAMVPLWGIYASSRKGTLPAPSLSLWERRALRALLVTIAVFFSINLTVGPCSINQHISSKTLRHVVFKAFKAFNAVSYYTLDLKAWDVFSWKNPYFSNFVYRVELVLDDGTRTEPFRSFDLEGHPTSHVKGFLSSSWVVAPCFKVGVLVDSFIRKPARLYLTETEQRWVLGLILHSINQLEARDQKRVVLAKILIKKAPFSELRASAPVPWPEDEWQPLVEWAFSRSAYRLLGKSDWTPVAPLLQGAVASKG